MRKSLLLFLIIGGLALAVGIFSNITYSKPESPKGVATTGNLISNITSSPKTEAVSNPSSFSIPALGIKNVMVESVGLDKENKMDTPSDSDNVAWYNLGAKPGEKGSAVIAGHLDKVSGEPAVFYDINKLKVGDLIEITDTNNKELEFEVTRIASYKLEDFPLNEVFASNDKPRLNLITCEGTFNKSSKLYSHRLVVYSELKSNT